MFYCRLNGNSSALSLTPSVVSLFDLFRPVALAHCSYSTYVGVLCVCERFPFSFVISVLLLLSVAGRLYIGNDFVFEWRFSFVGILFFFFVFLYSIPYSYVRCGRNGSLADHLCDVGRQPKWKG